MREKAIYLFTVLGGVASVAGLVAQVWVLRAGAADDAAFARIVGIIILFVVFCWASQRIRLNDDAFVRSMSVLYSLIFVSLLVWTWFVAIEILVTDGWDFAFSKSLSSPSFFESRTSLAVLSFGAAYGGAFYFVDRSEALVGQIASILLLAVFGWLLYLVAFSDDLAAFFMRSTAPAVFWGRATVIAMFLGLVFFLGRCLPRRDTA